MEHNSHVVCTVDDDGLQFYHLWCSCEWNVELSFEPSAEEISSLWVKHQIKILADSFIAAFSEFDAKFENFNGLK